MYKIIFLDYSLQDLLLTYKIIFRDIYIIFLDHGSWKLNLICHLFNDCLNKLFFLPSTNLFDPENN